MAEEDPWEIISTGPTAIAAPPTAPPADATQWDVPAPSRGPTQQSMHATMSAQPTGVGAWFGNAADDIRYGTQSTAVGKVLGALGAKGTSVGAAPETGEFMASVPIGLARVGQGTAQVASAPGAPAGQRGSQAWEGAKNIGGGALQASQIPLAFVGGAPGKVPAGTAGGMFPNAKKAGEVLGEIQQSIGHVPVDINLPGQVALRADQLAKSGGTLPKVIGDFLDFVTKRPHLTFQEARDFYSNATRLADPEYANLTGPMRKQVTDFVKALGDSLQQTAAQAGRGDEYASAINEYGRGMRRAQTVKGLKTVAKKELPKAAIKGLGITGAGGAALALYHQLFGKAQGGAIESDDDVLNELKRRGFDPGQNASIYDVPGDTSFSQAMAKANPLPRSVQRIKRAIDQPFAMPTTGGSPMSLADIVPIPQSTAEAGLLAAGAVLPAAKVLKGARGAVRAGTAMMEGAAPETGVLSRALQGAGEVPSGVATETPAYLKGLTGEAVLEKAGQEADEGFKAYTERNPPSNLFDLENAQPAIVGRSGQVPRYNPPRGVPARMSEALADPAALQTLENVVRKGQEVMPQSWYRTGPLYERFVAEYGPEEAARQYERLMQTTAATSTKNPVPSNIKAASYYNWLANQGMSIPDKPAAGYGSLAQGQHVAAVRELLEKGGLDPLKNPKRFSFAENLLGNETPVTIDTHNMRMLGIAREDPRFLALSVPVGEGKTKSYFKPREAFNQGNLTMQEALDRPVYWSSAPEKNEYAAYERAQQEMARKMGITPAEFQEKMWVGAAARTGLESPPEPFLQTFANRINYTAQRMGVDPKVVLDHFVKGKIPLLGGAGLAAGLGAGVGTRSNERQ